MAAAINRKEPHMKRLRHPISAIREPFGTAGLTVAILALVLAMVGGAYAAGGLTKAQEKQVTKIAKKFAGKPGKAGVAGATGPVGPAGPAGAAGKSGKEGSEGPQGKEGSPWTAGGTLPAGETETGTWGASPTAAATPTFHLTLPISIPIPLAAPLEDTEECGEAGHPACATHVFEGETIPPQCTGTVVSGTVTDLGAKPGNLCVYVRESSNITAAEFLVLDAEGPTSLGVGRDGARLTSAGSPAEAFAVGTWAVTAP
jgi:hypothetical protein